MEGIELKIRWIKAYRYTLEEYQHDTHEITTTKCYKCRVANLISPETLFNSMCLVCPECPTSFNIDDVDRTYPCMLRRIPPVNSSYITRIASLSSESSEIQKVFEYRKAIIQYHTEAVAYLETVLPITFQNHTEKISAHLREIMERIYLKNPDRLTSAYKLIEIIEREE